VGERRAVSRELEQCDAERDQRRGENWMIGRGLAEAGYSVSSYAPPQLPEVA
jgi:hypothetical protein